MRALTSDLATKACGDKLTTLPLMLLIAMTIDMNAKMAHFRCF